MTKQQQPPKIDYNAVQRVTADHFKYLPFPDRLKVRIKRTENGIFRYEKGDFDAKIKKVLFTPQGDVSSIDLSFNDKTLRVTPQEWDECIEAYSTLISLLVAAPGTIASERQKALVVKNRKLINEKCREAREKFAQAKKDIMDEIHAEEKRYEEEDEEENNDHGRAP